MRSVPSSPFLPYICCGVCLTEVDQGGNMKSCVKFEKEIHAVVSFLETQRWR